jgi:hypothetical protein
MTFRVKESENFERGQIVGSHLAAASVTNATTLFDVSREMDSNVLSAGCTNHRKTTSAKRNSGRKSTWTERYHHILRRIFCKNAELLQHR